MLGKLAGGLDIFGKLHGVMMTPLEAASVGGHRDCILVLEDTIRD